MSGVNKATLVGNLGADPELRYSPSGQAVCQLRVATTESRTDKDGAKKEYTEWHRVVIFNKLAELCNQYLVKGRQIYLEGRIQTRKWQDKEGNDRWTTEIIAYQVVFLSGGNGNRGAADAGDDAGEPSQPRGGGGGGGGGAGGRRDPAGGGGGAIFPPYGRCKGQPVAGAGLSDLEFYANGCRRSLADPGKSRWHAKEQVLLDAIEAEIERQGGGGGGGHEAPPAADEGWGGEPSGGEDDIPFARPPARGVTEVGGHRWRRAVWRQF